MSLAGIGTSKAQPGRVCAPGAQWVISMGATGPELSEATRTSRRVIGSCSQRGLHRLPSTAHRGASFLLSSGLQSNRETLHHQSDRRGNTVQVYPLRIQRQYTRFRRPGRQPPHPGRYRYQSARCRGAPPAHDVFIPRSSAAHLAGVIRATSSANSLLRVGALVQAGIEKQMVSGWPGCRVAAVFGYRLLFH